MLLSHTRRAEASSCGPALEQDGADGCALDGIRHVRECDRRTGVEDQLPLTARG